ncbi:MAG TPA: PA2779 family protein [Syntrophobacteria bacterium]|nr:PA2779 family protein [Syntrophobacteria bacterium]
MTLLLRSSLARRTAWVLVVLMGVLGFVPRLDAAFVPSTDSLPTLERQSDMARVQKVIEDKMVRERLKDLGYTAEEISARLDQLSDQELHALAAQLDTLTAGGSTSTVVIIILLVAILVVVVLMFYGKRIAVT